MKKHILVMSSIWLLTIGGSLIWNLADDHKGHESLQLQSARAFFRQIVLDRSWNAGHGGVYVPITDTVQPNPYLDEKFRDVTTTDGLKLTMINPAFMTRQIAELADEKDGVKFHITSLKPIRPENKATEWETAWLQAFENGDTEKYELVQDQSVSKIRYMAPLFIQQACLKCHARQGYKVGDIRGGISVTVPFPAIGTNWNHLITHGLVAVIGLLGIFFSGFLLNRGRTELLRNNEKLAHENKERKQYQAALEKSESLYRALVETTSAVAWEIDLTTLKFNYISPKVEDVFGYPKEEWPDFSFWADHIHPEDQEYAISFCQTEAAKGKDYEFEYRFLAADGNIIWVKDIVTVIKSDNVPVALRGILLDITKQKNEERERRRLEAKLQQAQKMEAIGTMAGGIAHDFNNILALIIGYTELALNYIPPKNQAKDGIQQVLIASNRAVELVKQILSFSRQKKQTLIPVNPRSLLRETLKFLRSTTPTTVSFVENISARCGTIIADPTQLHQLLMNLSANGVHSMGEKGELTISLQEVNLSDKDLAHKPGMTPGPYASISVTDTGIGMDKEKMDLVFDPFYTTKDIGKGTGLGLSVVHGIVENHGALMKVDSKPGQGSTFQVFFPIVADEELIESGSFEPMATGTERILFVDDEEGLASLGKLSLEVLGYKVTSETDSVAALATFKADPDRFDLLITDQSMPKMSGEELAAEVMKIKPNLPIILCTGFSNKISEKQAKEMGIKEFCLKPLDRKHLANMIRKVLDENSVLLEHIIERDLTVFTVTSEVTSHDLLNVLIEFYGNGPTENVLFDLGEVTLQSVLMSDVSYLTNFARRYDSDREGGKTAIVAKTGWPLELAEVFKEFSDTGGVPFQVEVFRDKENAMEWIDEK